MTKRLKPGISQTRSKGLGANERDDLYGNRSCGLHQGQRSNVPHEKAGHMTAPTKFVVIAV